MTANYPATPNKADGDVLPSAIGGMSQAHSASLNTLAIHPSSSDVEATSPLLVEPSPASTYGETAVGDSVPSTPNDIEGSAELSRDMGGIHLASGSDVKSQSAAREAKVSGFSPTSSETIAGSDTPSRRLLMPVVATPDRRRRSVGSPGDGNWRSRPSVSFVDGVEGHDPFSNEGPDTPSGSRGARARATSVSESFPDNQDNNKNKNNEGSPRVETPNSAFRPREDRKIVEISGDNAQALFPPSSCVFVANLVQGLADEQLEYSVSRAFEQFGKVYVKVKRDPRGMPYAFCQYEDAENAIRDGRGLMIDGRQCRTERAKVYRSLYLTRITGGTISESEARDILHGRGDLEKLWHPSPTEKEIYRLGDGIWVMFAFFQDCRDAQALFKDNTNYRLEAPHHPEDVQGRVGGRVSASPRTRTTPARRFASPPQYGMRQAIERNSVFVGGLPIDVTQAQIRSLLSDYGSLRSIEVISRPQPNGSFTVFAYVEFSQEDEARRAINNEHVLNDTRIRVEAKESSDRAASRFAGGASAGSPFPRRSAYLDSLSRDTAVARASAAGLDMNTVHQLFNPSLNPHTVLARTAVDQTSVAPPAYAQVPYQNYYAPSFPQYTMPAPAPEGNQINTGVYSAGPHVHPTMAHYSQPSGAYYHPNYSASAAYGYQAPAGSSSGNHAQSPIPRPSSQT